MYGSTCIEAVSGIRPDTWQWIDGRPNLEATKEAKAEKEALIAERLFKTTSEENDLNEKREAIREANKDRFEDLITVLHNASKYTGDFCSEMSRNIDAADFFTTLYDGILSPNQFQIVREIWGKNTGGRKNSKAYKVAVALFDEKFDDEDEDEE